MKAVASRNEQFEQIAALKASYQEAGNPVVSMDTKKKEHIGNFYRDGILYTTGVVNTYDHDFQHSLKEVQYARTIGMPNGLRFPFRFGM